MAGTPHGRERVAGATRALRRARPAAFAALATAATALATATHSTAASLPDGRAYEWVSPLPSDGNAVSHDAVNAVVNDDTVLFGGGGALVGPSASGATPIYRSTRTATGWQPTALQAPDLRPDEQQELVQATTDGSATVFSTAPTVIIGTPPANHPPLRLLDLDGAGVWHTLIADADPSTSPNDPSVSDASKVGAVAGDGDAIAFSSSATPSGLTPDQYQGQTMRKAYLWTPAGTRRLQAPTGDPLADCDTNAAATAYDFSKQTNAVSADGQSAFVQSAPTGGPGPNCPAAKEVFVNQGGANREISQPTDPGVPRIAPADETGSIFLGASPDASTAYFIATDRLARNAPASTGLPPSPGALYRWTAPSGSQPASVTCISCDPGTTPATNSGADDVSDAIVSADGQYVYFYAFGTIDGLGKDPGQDPTDSLFVYHDGTVQLVSLHPDEYDFGNETVTPTGSTILFHTFLGDNLFPTPQDPLQRAVVSGAGVSVSCVSCLADGTPEPGVTGLDYNAYAAGVPSVGSAMGYGAGAMSDDGDTVTFVSTGDLAPGGASGVKQVYRWQAGQGTALIASDQSSGGAETTPDGSNIFFFSSDPLTPDVTGPPTGNLFDARIGGGFPHALPPATQSPCAGDACQGAWSPLPPFPGYLTGAKTAGNVTPAPLPELRPRAVTAAAWRAFAGGRPLTLTVQVRGAGTVRATARSRIGSRAATVATAHARVRQPARSSRTVRLRLRLSAPARRQLARAGRLRVTVTVTLAHARSRRTTVTLTRRPNR